MNFLKHSKIFFVIALIAVGASIFSLFSFGLNLGIDFEGGSVVNVEYDNMPSIDEIRGSLSGIDELSGLQVQALGENEVSLKIKEKNVSNETLSLMIENLPEGFDESNISIETISPVIGKELKDKTLIVVVVALLAMLSYIALAFKSVSRPITSFQYGLSSTLMLFHDVIIPLGVISFLGYYYGIQLSIPIITAFLAIIGYSINNNIVIFDRIRENLKKDNSSYSEIVNKSLNETFVRCFNTSFTVLIVLVPLYYFFSTEESLKYFSLIMGVGVIIGFFSSLFLASPLLVSWNNFKNRKK
ncbi:MAG: protein translocase subunit SecF [Candidatus Pacebacteria bacterium]|nr:protein translocase subunit SecF [Candidatus Paceibacterota bacterium]MDD4074129.1 protein translocase subunit SecF [Candidatus Paceibacterota bacterium]